MIIMIGMQFRLTLGLACNYSQRRTYLMRVEAISSCSTTAMTSQTTPLLTSIHKGVSSIPPVRFFLPKQQQKLIHLDGNSLWKEINYLNMKQGADKNRKYYLKSTGRILPYFRKAYFDVFEKFEYKNIHTEYKERIPHVIDRKENRLIPNPKNNVSLLLGMAEFYKKEFHVTNTGQQAPQAVINGSTKCTSHVSTGIIVPYEHLDKLKLCFLRYKSIDMNLQKLSW